MNKVCISVTHKRLTVLALAIAAATGNLTHVAIIQVDKAGTPSVLSGIPTT